MKERAARWSHAWLIPFGALILAAWMVFASGGSVSSLPAFCSAASWRGLPLSASLDLALISYSFGALALGWAAMVVAMMLPLAIAPLWHVRERSFARRRTRSMLLFVAGFIAVWMMAGAVLATAAWLLQWAVPASVAIPLAVAIALVWQVSPAKQWCLNRCHQRPPLAAFGLDADVDAVSFGAAHGAACAGACWALMLPVLLTTQGEVLVMAAVALFTFAERLERPAPLAWRWRGGGKALRILVVWWAAATCNLERARYLMPPIKSRI
jgi:predicted metal-binding membrane protein